MNRINCEIYTQNCVNHFSMLVSYPSRNGYVPQYLRWAANFNPQNTQCMDACPDDEIIGAVEILARLDLTKTISFLEGHWSSFFAGTGSHPMGNI